MIRQIVKWPTHWLCGALAATGVLHVHAIYTSYLHLIIPALAFLYNPLTSLFSHTSIGVSTNTSKNGRLLDSCRLWAQSLSWEGSKECIMERSWEIKLETDKSHGTISHSFPPSLSLCDKEKQKRREQLFQHLQTTWPLQKSCEYSL